MSKKYDEEMQLPDVPQQQLSDGQGEQDFLAYPHEQVEIAGTDKTGSPQRRRNFLGKALALGVAGLAVLIPTGMRVGGAIAEDTVDSRADNTFQTLAQPIEASANATLQEGVNALETARPYVAQFTSVVQELQNVGAEQIDAFLKDLAKVPFINTTDLQHFVSAVTLLLNTKESDLVNTLTTMEQHLNNLKQQIADAERKAPGEINADINDGIRHIDWFAP